MTAKGDSRSGQVLLASASPRTPGFSYAVRWHGRASFRHHLHTATGLLRRAWFVPGDAWPRSSIGDLADLHAHRQERLLEFLLCPWETCFDAVFHRALHLLPHTEASTGHSTGLRLAMNGRSRTSRALAQEGRCVSVCLGLSLFSEAGSRLPIPYCSDNGGPQSPVHTILPYTTRLWS